MKEPFIFFTRFNLVRLLGLNVKDLTQMREALQTVPESSIYYHTHRSLQQRYHLSPEPTNDFAYWVANALRLKSLAEIIASVDTVSVRDLQELRRTFVKILEEYATGSCAPIECLPGEEFHFMSCTTYVLPAGYSCSTLKEMVEILKVITIDALVFHMFEARLRLGREDNDFAVWCAQIGEAKLAAELTRLDPYTYTLESLRSRIVGMMSEYA